MANELFVLAEVDNFSAIFAPLKSTHRIKYTCFNVSRNFLIFGATSGGLYVFRREPCLFLQLLPNKEGSITHVTVSPDEKFFAFSTLKGVVCILERSQVLKCRRIQMSVEHHGSEVTALQWNLFSNELFVGDDSGKISVVSVSAFMAKNMFQTPSFILMQLDSRIVQLDWCSELLLVSTLSRCYICDTVKEQYRQIGHKLRDGEYGACFYAAGDHHDLPSRSEQRGSTMGGTFSSLSEGEKLLGYEGVQNLKMFCARPGSRLWEVHIDGTVLSTHHFKQAFAVRPTDITRPHEAHSSNKEVGNVAENSQNDSWSQQSFNFTKLSIIAKKFLCTFKKDGIYVLDPDKGNVVLWNNNFKDIVDAKTLNDAIYVWTASGHIHAVVMLPVDRFLVRLYLRKQYALCAQLCEEHNNYLMELAPTSSKLQLLADLGTKLEDSEVARKIFPLLQEIGKHAQEKQNSQRLKSGIFRVGNTQFLWSKEEEGKEESLKSYSQVQSLTVDRHKEKSRSLSASPESCRRKKNGASQQQRNSASTTSLPELERTPNNTDVSTENYSQLHKLYTTGVHSNDDVFVFQTKSGLKGTKSSDSLCSSDPAFPPEAIQALKELRHSVSWKSLKEKWQMLEGKMKLLSQDTALEPLDVRRADYQEAILEEKYSCDDVELVHSPSDKLRPRTLIFPILDVSNIIDVCNRIGTCERNGGDASELIYELLNAINNVYELFITALINNHCGMVDDTVQSSDLCLLNNLKSELNIIGCFPFSHYFTDDMVKMIREKFHLALKTKYLITWLQDRVKDVQHTDQFPEYFSESCSEDTLKLDILLSKILVIFSELFDPKLTLQYIQTSELLCYYLSLCVILDRYQEGSYCYVAEDTPGNTIYEELPPPLLLNTIFFMFSMERVETCCKLGKQISIKDVWYLVMRLQQHFESNGKNKEAARSRCYSLFLSYLEKMSATSDCLSKVFADGQLRLYVTVAFGEINSAKHLSCVCGFPVLSPRTMLYSELADVMVLYYWDNNERYLKDLCKKVPSLWHLILPRRRNEGFSSVLPLIIHLGDILELNHWLPCMDHDSWVQTLDSLAKFHAGTCLNCGFIFKTSENQLGGIQWANVGPLIVKSLGPCEAVQLLTKYASQIKPGGLDARFFQSCIYSAIIDNHAKGLRNEVIDMLNEYTENATATSLFSPVVGPSLEEALKEDLGKPVEFPIASEKHYWGVKVNVADGNCPFCALPLGSPVLMKDGGLTTFLCGHSYHVVCLKRQTQRYTCPICTKNS